MMPTTRYGRFKYYRDRAKRRLRKIENRRVKTYDSVVHVTTCIDKSAATKQWPRRADGPRHVGNVPSAFESLWVEMVEAEYRRPAVLRFIAAWWLLHDPAKHNRSSYIGYQNRRVFWVPRLRQLDRFYPLPRPAVSARAAYPFVIYPSGLRNPRGFIAVDDFGVLPEGWEGWAGPGWIAGYLLPYYATPYEVPQDTRDGFPTDPDEWQHWLPIV